MRPRVALVRERVELPDGDFLDLDWSPGGSECAVVVIHGLEGSSRSVYVLGLMQALRAKGWRSVAMHFRGCSGEPNRHSRSYCAGETEDVGFVIDHVRSRCEGLPIVAVGYSLGGCALLNWIAASGAGANIAGAVGVSVPFKLAEAASRMRSGISYLYQWHLLRRLRSTYRRKYANRADAPVPMTGVAQLNDFFSFDNAITAPLHGYRNVADYYGRASCRQRLAEIVVPTLLLHALDDPFMTPETAPSAEELSPSTRLELSEHGGHVGFVEGTIARPRYWLERRIPAFVEDLMSERACNRVATQSEIPCPI